MSPSLQQLLLLLHVIEVNLCKDNDNFLLNLSSLFLTCQPFGNNPGNELGHFKKLKT